MLGKLSKWAQRQMAAFALAAAAVEKESITQMGVGAEEIGIVQRKSMGTLADDLVNGKKTQEVEMLRARMYKVEAAADKVRYTGGITKLEQEEPGSNVDVENTQVDIEFSGHTVTEYDRTIIPDSVKGDPSNEEKVELIINTEKPTITVKEALGGENMIDKDSLKLHITRDFRPAFEIERYSKKMIVRDLGDDEKLLEIYLSMYPDADDRKTRLLIAEIKRAMVNPRASTILEFEKLGFVTRNDLGAEKNRLFEYDFIAFDKIVEFDGSYILKFKVKEIIANHDITKQYENEELNEKYDNNERR